MWEEAVPPPVAPPVMAAVRAHTLVQFSYVPLPCGQRAASHSCKQRGTPVPLAPCWAQASAQPVWLNPGTCGEVEGRRGEHTHAIRGAIKCN